MSAPETQQAPWWKSMVLNHRITLSAAFGVLALVFAYPSREALLWGLPFIVLGEAIRIWASGHIHKMAKVTTTGPYALCRHPLYLGHAVITLGFLIGAGNLWLIPIGLAVFLLIFLPTMEREETHLTELFGDEYRHYMQAVPRFVPRWSSDSREGAFDWQLVKKHREANNIYGLIGGIVALALLGLLRGSW